MDVTDAHSIDINESSQIGDARRQIVKFAHHHGFSEPNEARLGLICAELGTNLLKHTTSGGKLIVQGITQGDRIGIEVFSMDSGNGMNVNECLKDGYSSTGTMGTGLGAVQRNSDSFDIYSERTKGAVVQALIWNTKNGKSAEQLHGGLTVPKSGELLSGDKWAIADLGSVAYCLLVDGLGHGIEAAEAANLAVKRFKENTSKPPTEIMRAMHKALRGTRGAVGAVAQIDKENNRLHFCGLGNIAGIVVGENERKHLTSMNGTIGYEARKFSEFTVPWSQDSLLVMHSDGLSSKTFEDIDSIRGLSAPIIAAWLYQRYSKGSDDSTVLAFKEKRFK
jgi:anti-sigma regulatory factor (Ser/Thr protein kinase)